MTYELARALLLSETLTPTTLGEALLTAAREGVSLSRALLTLRAVDASRLDKELGRGDVPSLRQVLPVPELMDRLPQGLCARLMAFPVRLDPRTGTVDVAVADTRDPHAPEEIGYHLDAAVRVLRAPVWALEAALAASIPPPPSVPPSSIAQSQPPSWYREEKPTPAWGSSSLFSEPPPAARETHSDVVLPLTRKTLRQVRAFDEELPTATDHRPDPAYVASPYEPADDLMQAVENAVQYAAVERQRNTLIPPTFAVPPPPNTERRPAVLPSSPPPPSRRSNPPTMPFVDVAAVLAAIRASKGRDELLDLVLLGARTVARRVAIFALKREEFVGWSCTPEFARIEDLRAISLSLHAPSVLMLGAVAGGYLGPINKSDVHAPLLRLMGHSTRDVAVAALRVLGRPAAIILADELGDTMLATRRLDEIARAAGDQLANIVRDRR